MNPRVIALFLFASWWFYIATTLILSDRRWNAGRIVQSILCGSGCVWLLAAGLTEISWLTTVALTFALTVIIPGMLRQRAASLILANDIAGAKARFLAATFLSWMRERETTKSLDQLAATIDIALAHPAARRHYARGLTGVLWADSRAGLLAARIELLVALHQHQAATDLYDREFAGGQRKADPSLIFVMAIAYADLGRLPEAIRAIRRAEGMEKLPEPLDARRFLAHLRVHAHAGHPQEVVELLVRNERLAALLPPAHPLVWLGVACMNVGQPEAAEEHFNFAGTQLGTNDELLVRRIADCRAQLQRTTEPVKISEDTADALTALHHDWRQTPSPRFEVDAGWRPVTTWTIVAVCIGMWLLMKWTQTTSLQLALLHFGANAPALVKHGQWWRMMTSVFLHISLMHLVFNCIACYLFGSFVERTTGRKGIFTTFVLSGLAGSAASALLGHADLAAGASGAIFGLLGAAIVIVFRLKGVFSRRMRRRYALNFIFIAAAEMVFGLMEPHIDNFAHWGGFVAGILCGLVLMSNSGTGVRSQAWRLASFVSVALLISAGGGLGYDLQRGGYPYRTLPRRTYKSHLGFRVDVPIIWSRQQKDVREMVVRDPFGLELRVHPADNGNIQALENSSAAERYALGPYYVFLDENTMGQPLMETMICATPVGSQWYILKFVYEKADRDHYLSLIHEILTSFELIPKEQGKGGSESRLETTYFRPYLSSLR